MSEIGYISSQYERLSQTNQYLNEAVLLLKKDWLLGQPDTLTKYPTLSVEADDLRTAREYVSEVLGPMADMPGELMIDRLLDDRQLPPRPELADVVQTIQQQRTLQSRHFATLNRLLDALDGERSVLFRKLRTGK